jgi:hypothetical protein
MQKWIIAARAGVPTLLREGVGYLGASLIVYGTWEVYHPAGFILAGACLVAGAVLHGGLSS